jgi:hypothetical protein
LTVSAEGGGGGQDLGASADAVAGQAASIAASAAGPSQAGRR